MILELFRIFWVVSLLNTLEYLLSQLNTSHIINRATVTDEKFADTPLESNSKLQPYNEKLLPNTLTANCLEIPTTSLLLNLMLILTLVLSVVYGSILTAHFNYIMLEGIFFPSTSLSLGSYPNHERALRWG